MSYAIEEIAVGDLKPWAKNARTHSKKQLRQIGESISTFGFTNPVLIDADNTILAGHGRVAAAKLIGMSEVPCVRLEYMTPEQKRAYVLADNKLALNAGWDEELLAEELQFLMGIAGPATKQEKAEWDSILGEKAVLEDSVAKLIEANA